MGIFRLQFVDSLINLTNQSLTPDQSLLSIFPSIADVGSIIDFMESDGGVDVAFTGPTFSGGVFGDGVGGAVRKEDTEILEMWNAAISEMSKDGTTAEITKKWFGRDISM